MREVRLSIVGFGVVGRGVTEVIRRKRAEIKEKFGLDLRVVAIVDLWGAVLASSDGKSGNEIDVDKVLDALQRGKADGLSPRESLETHGIKVEDMQSLEVIKEVEHDVMVEATPTNVESDGEPGTSHILEALKAGRHVVTSNKGPLALHFKKLMRAAERADRKIGFEATVGGAMPIISLREALAGNEILSIKGILNGTCNYILTRMSEENLPFEHALREAQEIGIAEADPKSDVLGVDTAVKLVILANALLGLDASYKDVSVTGITEITPEALNLAKNNGYVIKLIGEVDRDGKLEVAPKLVPKTHPLNVSGTLNAALLKTDLAGEIVVVGRGAGGIEAASAIIGDVIRIFRSS
ncbi:MAG: Homoserine dehydrogenase [Candidatus Alkanophagales archaeon MCA70_species_1]|nr:Homoserine dehydrogenase [Candidatus Alkanophaga volatiphilum]